MRIRVIGGDGAWAAFHSDVLFDSDKNGDKGSSIPLRHL
jgi:hypothetical protein